MELSKEDEQEIKEFLAYQGYDLTIEYLLEEYEKYKDWDYVSHSYKKTFERFEMLFPRD